MTEPNARERELAASIDLNARCNWTEAIARLLAAYRAELLTCPFCGAEGWASCHGEHENDE